MEDHDDADDDERLHGAWYVVAFGCLLALILGVSTYAHARSDPIKSHSFAPNAAYSYVPVTPSTVPIAPTAAVPITRPPGYAERCLAEYQEVERARELGPDARGYLTSVDYDCK